jgi:hypothetical protein
VTSLAAALVAALVAETAFRSPGKQQPCSTNKSPRLCQGALLLRTAISRVRRACSFQRGSLCVSVTLQWYVLHQRRTDGGRLCQEVAAEKLVGIAKGSGGSRAMLPRALRCTSIPGKAVTSAGVSFDSDTFIDTTQFRHQHVCVPAVYRTRFIAVHQQNGSPNGRDLSSRPSRACARVRMTELNGASTPSRSKKQTRIILTLAHAAVRSTRRRSSRVKRSGLVGDAITGPT